MRTALYPGTFDPITLGHLDVLNRASLIFDRVIIGVAHNLSKSPTLSLEERTRLIEENLKDLPNIEIQSFDGLVVDFAKQIGAVALIRGLRAVSDFEYELQMAQMNRNLDESIETLFLMPNEAYTFISSTLIKQVAIYGGDISKFVPPNVYEALKEHFPKLKENEC
ncbi:MAG: pantetheine-phosphate adenylyltransferase [Opitutales bacterium]|jgi:pantetheine-phosphate adenylyltransferase|nr:pantetheine-phosphate adenylyltransferase [Opitutales bacterium]MDB2499293.1 pantetheine-phosphate adenylyltransferase [bacterium]MDG2169829.1 pantetheine-phosphate adenylyltransferase [Opitutales bacterium]